MLTEMLKYKCSNVRGSSTGASPQQLLERKEEFQRNGRKGWYLEYRKIALKSAITALSNWQNYKHGTARDTK